MNRDQALQVIESFARAQDIEGLSKALAVMLSLANKVYSSLSERELQAVRVYTA